MRRGGYASLQDGGAAGEYVPPRPSLFHKIATAAGWIFLAIAAVAVVAIIGG